jgi:FMN phosphatase YigB (HAD superfamily)
MPKIRAVVFDCYGTLVDILTDEGKTPSLITFHFICIIMNERT